MALMTGRAAHSSSSRAVPSAPIADQPFSSPRRMMGSGDSVSSSSSSIDDTLPTSRTLHGLATESAVDVRNMGGSDTGLGGVALSGEGDALHESSM